MQGRKKGFIGDGINHGSRVKNEGRMGATKE